MEFCSAYAMKDIHYKYIVLLNIWNDILFVIYIMCLITYKEYKFENSSQSGARERTTQLAGRHFAYGSLDLVHVDPQFPWASWVTTTEHIAMSLPSTNECVPALPPPHRELGNLDIKNWMRLLEL